MVSSSFRMPQVPQVPGAQEVASSRHHENGKATLRLAALLDCFETNGRWVILYVCILYQINVYIYIYTRCIVVLCMIHIVLWYCVCIYIYRDK